VSPGAHEVALAADAAVAHSRDGSLAQLADAHQTRLVELPGGRARHVAAGAVAVAFDPACARFVRCDGDGSVSVHGLDGKSTRYAGGSDGPCRALALAGDGTVALATGTTVLVWRAPTVPPRRLEHATPVAQVALTSDATRLVSGGPGAPQRLWQLDAAPLPPPPADAIGLRAWLDAITTLAFDDQDLLR
jgi:hypothetical protein